MQQVERTQQLAASSSDLLFAGFVELSQQASPERERRGRRAEHDWADDACFQRQDLLFMAHL